MADVTFEDVSKSYKDGPRAVDHLNLGITDGEFMVLVGPSGCGKSTALRMIAGLEEISEGTLRIGERVVNDVPPGDRDIAMVFQNYALYPHMTVRQNIGFALEVAGVKKDEIRRRVDDAGALLGLTEYLDRLPKALSGGQRQRVAMGRAIVRSPQVFLMDEPLSNLDAKLRVQMRSEIIQLQSRLGTTMVYVTHDQVEAMTMGHRVAVMRKGVLQQVAPPQELYLRPANLFVASFIGSPSMNLVRARLVRSGDGLEAVFAEHRLAVDPRTLERAPGIAAHAGEEIVLGLRPEHFAMVDGDGAGAPGDGRTIVLEATLAEAMGAEVHIHATVDVPPVLVEGAPAAEEHEAGVASPGTRIIARVEGHHVVKMGDRVPLRVNMALAQYFDPVTGEPLR